MGKDISIVLDDVKLNIRVGVIFRYKDLVLVEISKEGKNSVVPGGRVKFMEDTSDTISRELNEELGFVPDKDKLKFNRVVENFYTYDGLNVHELFFLYEYVLNGDEYEYLDTVGDNLDSNSTYFKFIEVDKLGEVNLLPEVLLDIIK